MKPIAYLADVSSDFAAPRNDGFIRPHYVFHQFGLEPFPCLDSADIEPVLTPHEKRGSVGNGMRRSSGFLLLGEQRQSCQSQSQTQEPAKPSHKQNLHVARATCQLGWMYAATELLPAPQVAR